MRYFVVKRQFAIVLICAVGCLIISATRGVGKAIQANATPVQHPIYSVETDTPLVSLGINCAWDDTDIPEMLSILEQQNVKATFFLVGDWCDAYPESVKALYAAGHELGSHSDTHPDMTKLDRESIYREVRDSAAKIQALTGQMPELFRPPSGAYNSTVVEVIRQEGFYPIQWDCDSVDYKNPTTLQMQTRILKKLRNGSILLFHSGAKNTPEALPIIIADIKSKGYSFVPVGELIHRGLYTTDFEGRQHSVVKES